MSEHTDELRSLKLRQAWGELTGGPDYDSWIEGKLFAAQDESKELRKRLSAALSAVYSLREPLCSEIHHNKGERHECGDECPAEARVKEYIRIATATEKEKDE